MQAYRYTSTIRTKQAQAGFTLIELMMTIAIVAILAAIAMPSYRRYTVMNAESQAQAKMKQLQMELENWRANSLTYKGFKPKKVASDGTVAYDYDSSKTIIIPDATNPRYTITLESISGEDLDEDGTIGSTSYNGWRMFAQPNQSLQDYGASNIMLNSRGVACKAPSTVSMPAESTSCPSGAQAW